MSVPTPENEAKGKPSRESRNSLWRDFEFYLNIIFGVIGFPTILMGFTAGVFPTPMGELEFKVFLLK